MMEQKRLDPCEETLWFFEVTGDSHPNRKMFSVLYISCPTPHVGQIAKN